MENTLKSEIHRISSSKIVPKPEQAILKVINDYHLIQNEIDFSNIEEDFIRLLDINNGEISVQCSVMIARCIVDAYKTRGENTALEKFSILIKKLTDSKLIAIGLFAKFLSSECKSEFQNAVDAILGKSPVCLSYNSLFALKCLFNTKEKCLNRYLKVIPRYLKKTIQHSSESELIMCLKLMKSLVNYDNYMITQVLNFVDELLLGTQTLFTRNEIASLIANIAVIYSNDKIDSALELIKKYQVNINLTIQRFLEILPYDEIHKFYSKIFCFIKNYSPSNIDDISIFGTKDENSFLFNEILSEKPSYQNLYALSSMANKEDDYYALCNLAKRSCKSNNIQDRNCTYSFIAEIPKISIEISKSFFQSLISLLLTDKKGNSCFENGFLSFSLIENYPDLGNIYSKIILKYLDKYIDDNFDSYGFCYLWGICAYLRSNVLPKSKMEDQLIKVYRFLNKANPLSEINTLLLNNILLFYSKHCDFQYSDNYYNLISIKIEQCQYSTFYYFIDFIIALRENCDQIALPLLKKCYNINPSKDFIKNQIHSVLISSEDILIKSKIEIMNDSKMLAQKIVLKFPIILKKCNKDTQKNIISSLVENPTYTSQCILLSIAKDDLFISLFPQNVIGSILHLLKGNDYLKIQIICETVAIIAFKKSNIIAPLFKFIELNKRSSICLLISSIMCHNHLSDNYISKVFLLLNELIFCKASAPMALHAFSVAFLTHGKDIKLLKLESNQINILIQMLHLKTSLHPLIFYTISHTFQILLKLQDNLFNDYTRSSILSFLQSLLCTPLNIGKGLYYSQIVELAKISSTFTNSIKIETHNSKNLSIALTASQAFSYFNIDYSEFLPKVLMLVKKSSNESYIDFVVSLIQKSSNEFIINLIYSIFTQNLIPEVSIEPDLIIKIILLKSLPKLRPGDDIYKIVVILIIAASSNIIQIQKISFPLLAQLNKIYDIDAFNSHLSILLEKAFNIDLTISLDFILSACSNNIELCAEKISMYDEFSIDLVPVLSKIIKHRESKNDFINKFIEKNEQKLINLARKLMNVNLNYNPTILIQVLQIQNISNNKNFKEDDVFSYLSLQLDLLVDEKLIKENIDCCANIIKFVKIDLLKSYIKLLIKKLPLNNLKQSISDFCLITSRRVDLDSEIWNLLLKSIINNDFDFETAARTFDNIEPESILNNSNPLIKSLIKKYNTENEKYIISLFVFLFEKVPKIISLVVDFIINYDNLDTFIFDLLYIITQMEADSSNLEVISKFVTSNLNNGGIAFVNRILCNDKICIKLQMDEIIDEVIELLEKDISHSYSYIEFVIIYIKKTDETAQSSKLIRALMKLFNESIQNVSKDSLILCINAFKIFHEKNDELFKTIYESLDELNRQSIIKYLSD